MSPALDQLLPESQFQLYGVSTRFPQKLDRQVELTPLSHGVYEESKPFVGVVSSAAKAAGGLLHYEQ